MFLNINEKYTEYKIEIAHDFPNVTRSVQQQARPLIMSCSHIKKVRSQLAVILLFLSLTCTLIYGFASLRVCLELVRLKLLLHSLKETLKLVPRHFQQPLNMEP